MKTLIRIALLCLFTLGAGSVLAQSVTIATPGGTIVPGQVVVVPLNFTQGSTQIGSLDVRISVSTAQFSAISLDCTSQTIGASFNLCSNVNAASGQVSIRLSGNGSAQLTTGKLGDLTLTVAPGATPNAAEPVPGVVEGVGDVTGDNDLPNNTISVTNGSLNIAGPLYVSNPSAGGGTEFVFGPVVQNAALPTQNLVITNTGVGTLTGTCTETLDAGNVFTVTNGAYSADASLSDTVTVACDSAGAVGTHTGQMSCSHNGGNVASPVVYDLSCNITAGPQPAFSSTNPAAGGNINLAVSEAGDPDPSQIMTITNSGAATTTLTGTCAMQGGSDLQISVTGGSFNVAQGAPGAMVTVSCDASIQGNYSGTLSCSHNGSSPASPVDYAVSCVVPEAGAAIFASNPAPGPIDVDGGADVVVGDTDPTSVLTLFNNADPGDQRLDISCSLSGDAAISVSPDISSGIFISADSSAAVTFACDTATSGDFAATYSCAYQNGGQEPPVGGSPVVNVVYDLSCNVRDKEAQVEPSPASGTTLSGSIPPGGTASFNVTFPEVNDEGLDASLVSCSLNDGSVFSITSPASFPQPITAGSSVTVTVQGTDPGGAENLTDVLTCTFNDSDDDGRVVTYPISVSIGGNAQFHVLKEFTDGNPGNVTVDLDCDTGLILDQSKVIHEDGIGVTFIVSDFDAGELNCNVTERPVPGYIAQYDAGGSDSDYTDADDGQANPGCYWTEVAGSDFNTCVITNSPSAVDVVVTKEWLYPGSAEGGSFVSEDFTIILVCENASIAGGAPLYQPKGTVESPSGVIEVVDSCAFGGGDWGIPFDAGGDYCKTLYGHGNSVFTEQVTPHSYPGGICYAYETRVDDAVEVDNGCMAGGRNPGVMKVGAGQGAACTITNTVFYEGIPTLSEYGMALLALLMLGMGFVAVRRIA